MEERRQLKWLFIYMEIGEDRECVLRSSNLYALKRERCGLSLKLKKHIERERARVWCDDDVTDGVILRTRWEHGCTRLENIC